MQTTFCAEYIPCLAASPEDVTFVFGSSVKAVPPKSEAHISCCSPAPYAAIQHNKGTTKWQLLLKKESKFLPSMKYT